jgi:lysophospholipase
VTEGRWLTPDGWPLRRIDWPQPAECRGSLLFLPGRGDAYEKYLETLDHWRGQGWRVTAADWRGQAGSGRLGNDAVTGHVEDFAVWIADLADFWAQWKAQTPGPHVIAGHSMGGHLVLRAVAERAIDPDAVVLSAPMLGLHTYGLPLAVIHAVAKLMCRVGDKRRPAWKWSEKPGELPQGRDLLLTHDAVRYADETAWRDARPDLVMGPGSWGWVERSYASIRKMQCPGFLEAVTTPVFVVATRVDGLVSFDAIARAVGRMPHAEMLTFGEEARHEVLREVDDVRDVALAAIDAFLAHIVPTGTATA